MRRLAVVTCVFLLCCLPPRAARASCGVEGCPVNVDLWFQALDEGLQTRLDFRYESFTQDQPHFGSRAVAVGQIRRHHDEVSTHNQNLVVSADVALTRNWGFTVQAPIVIERSHLHIHNHRGARLFERWDFGGLGDVRLLGRFQTDVDAKTRSVAGARFGFKLPTGKIDERNGDGDLAERTLQPGTGTLDAIVGGYYSQALGKRSHWFTSASYQFPLTTRDRYCPGTRFDLDVGARTAFSARVSGLLTANLRVRGRDAGANAEPESTGGTFVYLSPGLSWQATDQVSIYGLVQVPIHQAVHDVQLTYPYAVTAGVTWRL